MTWTLDAEARLGESLLVRRYLWPTGLRLIWARDRGAPIVSYQTWLAVGSSDERPGTTGIAHLFEHLMFNQTANLAYGEFDRLIERTGGDTNAATWVDWTSYCDNVPVRDLELVVRLEADRLRHLTLDDEQLECERQVVINERMLRVDDDVDGFLDEELFRHAFAAHPYHWPTIGWMEDIRAIDRATVHDFYRRHYSPDNACLVVVGDVDADHLLELVARYYGEIPAANHTREALPAEPEPSGERVLRFAKPVFADRLVLGYRAPAMSHDDWPVLEMIAGLLVDAGPSARLSRRLVTDGELAASVDAHLTPFRDPGLFQICASLDEGRSSAEALAAIDDELDRLAREPVPEAELEKVRNAVETDFYSNLASVDGKAEAFGSYEITLGDFRHLFAMAGRLRAVDAGEIQRVARAYLRRERRTVVIAEPER